MINLKQLMFVLLGIAIGIVAFTILFEKKTIFEDIEACRGIYRKELVAKDEETINKTTDCFAQIAIIVQSSQFYDQPQTTHPR